MSNLYEEKKSNSLTTYLLKCYSDNPNKNFLIQKAKNMGVSNRIAEVYVEIIIEQYDMIMEENSNFE